MRRSSDDTPFGALNVDGRRTHRSASRSTAAGRCSRISGEHDLSTAPELRARLHELGDTSAVIIDLDETTFVDSSILGVLVGGLRRARERDVPFGLVLGTRRTRRSAGSSS